MFGRSIEPRARRAPGAGSRAIPGPPAARAAPMRGCGAVKTKSPYDHAYDPDIRAARPRQLGNWAARFSYTPHPPPDPSGSRPPRAPWRSHRRQATAPVPAAIRFLVARRRRPATPDTAGAAVRHRTPRAARTGRADQAPAGGHSRPFIFPPAPPHSRDARATITHSGHTFTLDPALKPVSHPPETLSLALNSSTLPLILTHTHPLTLTHWRCVSMRTSLGVVERVA